MEIIYPYDIAPIRWRLAAFVIDYFLFSFVAIAMFATLKLAFALPLSLIGILLYWPVSEAVYGKTIGKRLFKLKVVTTSYEKANLFQTILRFFFILLDLQLAMGLILAVVDKQNQRIGDKVANTLVVIDRPKTYGFQEDWTC